MAEKEERICITKLGPNPSDCFLIDNTCDGMCVRCTQGMSRQYAIEKMAKALRSNIVETQAQCSCLNMAEAALNALLSE